MAIGFLAVSSFLGLVVVTPIKNHFDPDGGWGNFTDYSTFHYETDKNNPRDDNDGDRSYLWAYLVFVYVFTALLSYFLVRQSSIVSKRRQQYLGSQSSVADRTIKISGIPHELRTEGKLQDFIEKLRIGDVSAVTICRNWREIDQLAEKRAAALRKLEEAYVVLEGGRKIDRDLQTLPVVQPTPATDRPVSVGEAEDQPLINGHRKPNRRRPKIKTGPWGMMGKEVDAIDYYTAKLQHLDETILEARKKEYTATPMAFVTFDKVSGAVLPQYALSNT
jgi:calcium permeable stress-gated cation channel